MTEGYERSLRPIGGAFLATESFPAMRGCAIMPTVRLVDKGQEAAAIW